MQTDGFNGRPAAETERLPHPLRPAPPHYFFWSLFGVFGMIVGALILLRMITLPTAVLEDQQRRSAINLLPNDETVALKLSYADERPPYDVGLFGNSRILMVGGDELGLGNSRVFNFAIGGESVRQSIRLLEELHARRKAPAIAVISMDHAELGLLGGLGVSPGPPARWLEEAADAWIAWRAEGLRSAAVQIINGGAAEGQEFAITFKHFFVLYKLRALLTGAAGPPTNYRADGSHKEIIPDSSVAIKSLPRRADTYPQLESDFARLAAIRDSDVRVLIYETPIAPSLGHREDRDLSVKARDVRRRFHEACAKYRLECYGPPVLDAKPWFDRDHAPADQLAAWLRFLIDKTN